MIRIRNLLLGLFVSATLGFGVLSATAQPRDVERTHICPFVRTYDDCMECCSPEGGIWDGARCTCS